MAEAMALVGLASSIVTFLDLSAKIVVLIHECKASASVDRFYDIESQLPLLCKIFEGMQDDIKLQNISQATADALKQAVQGCLRQAKIIEDLVQQMTVDPAESKVKQVLGAVKRVQKNKKLGEAWRILETYKTTMTMYLSRTRQLAETLTQAPLSLSLSTFNVPTCSVAEFIGRKTILENLKHTLYQSSPGHNRAAVLHGMGGQGKTQTALEFCRRATLDGAFECIYWIDCSTNESIILDFETLASKMAPGRPQFPDGDAAIQYAKGSLSNAVSPWLLIFDNLDDPDVFKDVKSYVPNVLANGSILYISRHSDTARLGAPFSVQGMTEDEAVQLLLHRSQAETTDENLAHAKSIAAELGFFPLAMDQAASYIHSRRLPLAKFLTYYSKRKAEILRHTPRFWEYKKGPLKQNSIAINAFTTWELSMALLLDTPEGQNIERMLTLAAFFDNRSLHSDLFKASVLHEEGFPQWISCMHTDGAWDEYKFQDVIADLLSLSLIQSMDLLSHGVSFTLHPLVRDWIQHRLSEKEYGLYAHQAIETLGLAVEHVNLDSITPATRKLIIANMDASINNAQQILASDEHTDCENLLVSLGWLAHCYVESGRYSTGRDLYKTLLDLRLSQQRPPDDLEYTSTAMNLVSVYNYLGFNAEAKSLCTRVVQDRETHLGLDHEKTQWALYGLATTEYYLQEYKQSTKLFESLLKTQASQLPERRAYFVKTLSQLANVYRATKYFRLAQVCYEVALMEWVKKLGPFHQTTLIALEGLAIIYRNLGRVDEATKLYAQIMARHEAFFGWEHPRTLRLATNYGIALIHQKEYDEAIQLLKKATDGFETLLGPSHPDTLWSKLHLSDGELVRDQKFNQALLHYGLQTASCYVISETKSRAAPEETGNKNHRGNDADTGRKEIAPSTTSQPTWEEIRRKMREKAQLKSKPYPSWNELNSVFDSSGANDIQAAANYQETFWRRGGHSNGPVGDGIAELLRSAMRWNYSDLLDLLENHYDLGPNEVNKSCNTQLYRAAYSGDLESVKTLLARPNIDANKTKSAWDRTPIMAACWTGQEAVVEMLLAHRPFINLNGPPGSESNALIEAVDTHSGSCPSKHNPDTFRIVKLLLETGRVDVNYVAAKSRSYGRNTALSAAAGRGDVESVKLLLAAGAHDINSNENSGNETALHQALCNGYSAIARLLIEEAGSDVSAITEGGNTCLHHVRDMETCRLLLRLGAGDEGRINAQTSSYGQTALHRTSDGEIARTLLEAGADMGIRNADGETAFFSAVQVWKSDVVKVMLTFGKSEIDVPAAKGVTPLEQAFSVANEGMVQVLIEAGAKVDLDALRKADMAKYKKENRREDMLEMVERMMKSTAQ